jgi:D-amino-acid dehydrogenase
VRVLVIGAGVIGVSTAYFLRRHAIDVTVVDGSPGPGLQTSYGNAGLLTMSLADPWNAPRIWRLLIGSIGREDAPILIRWKALPSLIGWGARFLRNSNAELFMKCFHKNVKLAKYNLVVLHELQRSTKLTFNHQKQGTLRIFRDSKALQAASRVAARHSEILGLRSKKLSREELLIIEPALAPIAAELVGAIHYPDDESGDAQSYCSQLAEIAAAEDVRFRYCATVRALLSNGQRVLAAQLDDGTALEADVVVLAAGSYSAAIARSLDLYLPVRPAKGYSITVRDSDQARRPSVPVIDDRLHAAVVPIGDRLRVAGTAELAGFDLTVKPRRIHNLVHLLQSIYPNVRIPQVLAEMQPWAGLRPMSADGVPILGETSIPNLVLNTGHGHLGWSTAAASGKLIADLLVGQPPEISLRDYALKRFK